MSREARDGVIDKKRPVAAAGVVGGSLRSLTPLCLPGKAAAHNGSDRSSCRADL